MADDNKEEEEKKSENKAFDGDAVIRESTNMRIALIKKDAKEIKKQFDKILQDNNKEGKQIKYCVVFGWDYKHRKILFVVPNSYEFAVRYSKNPFGFDEWEAFTYGDVERVLRGDEPHI